MRDVSRCSGIASLSALGLTLLLLGGEREAPSIVKDVGWEAYARTKAFVSRLCYGHLVKPPP